MVSKYKVVLLVQVFQLCVAILYLPVCLHQLLRTVSITLGHVYMRVRSALRHLYRVANR